jgi:hypothetical protein
MRSAITTAIIFASLAGQAFADDKGGAFQPYVDRVNAINALGGSYHISGWCESSCAAYLGVRKLCIEADAEVWVHGVGAGRALHDPNPWVQDSAILPSENSRLLWLISKARPALARYISATGYLNTRELKQLSTRDLIALGVPTCKQ